MELHPGERASVEAKLEGKGYKVADATIVVEQWTSPLPKAFKFKTPIPSADAKCKSTWGTRVFRHTDWVDGSSLVQAGETPSEEGFNNRFHDIENDLDRLGASVGVAFDCVNELRATVAQLANEISAHYDAIAAVIASCCNRTGTTTLTGVTVGGGKVVGTLHLDEDVDIVLVEDDNGGLKLFPKGGDPRPEGGGVYDPMRSRSAEFLRILTVDEAIRGAFGGRRGVTKDELLAQFGDVSAGGRTLAEVIDVLPSGATFQTVDTMVAGLTESESATLKSSRGVDAVLSGSFNKPVLSGGSAPLTSFVALSGEVRSALTQAGITTVGELAKSTVGQVNEALLQGQVEGGPGDAGALIGAAMLIGHF